jgi:hypothetical protein
LCESEPDRVVQLLDDIAERPRDAQDDDLTHGMAFDRWSLRGRVAFGPA